MAALSLAAASAMALLLAPPAHGQQKKDEPPAMEVINLETKDGVNLKCAWYAGTKGKEAVPIIMLHGFQGQKEAYSRIATILQADGHAVAVPDLRGHGGSLSVTGVSAPIELDRMRPADFAKMLLDVEAVKSFLLEKNNKGELNIELLTVIGADMGAALALRWAMQDWSWPQLPALKQGQDVKALVLLSPVRSFKGVDASKALSFPIIRDQLSILVAVGADDPGSLRDAKRIYSGFSNKRPEFAPEEAAQKQTLFYIEVDTNLQGTQLLDPRLDLERKIKGFIDLRLVNKKDEFPWRDRKSPLSGSE
jgi:pimeloyl-ACP methyl ester carboxylesterase